MQALKMLLWVRWRETRQLLGIVYLCFLVYGVAVWTGYAVGFLPAGYFSLLLAGVTLFSRQDARGRSLGLPSYMHRLPLPSWKLAAADLLFTILVVMAFFAVPLSISQFIFFLQPDIMGLSVLGFVYAVVLPVIVLWALQAILWLIGPVNLFAAVVLMLYAMAWIIGMWSSLIVVDKTRDLTVHVSPILIAAKILLAFFVPLAVSFVLAVWAVRLDRTGRLAALRGRLENLPLFAVFRTRPFASPWQAQVWREGAREWGIMLALMIGCILVALAMEANVDREIRPDSWSWRTTAMFKGGVTAAWFAGLLLSLRRRRERDTLGAGHMLTLPVSTLHLAVARLRADAGVAALGCAIFLLGWVLCGGWADQASVWMMAAQLAGSMLLIALLYLAAMPTLGALVLIGAFWVFYIALMAEHIADPRPTLALGVAVMVVASAVLIGYVYTKKMLSWWMMTAGLVSAVLAGLTVGLAVPLAVNALFGVRGIGSLLFGAAVGALMLMPFIATPLAMQRMRHR